VRRRPVSRNGMDAGAHNGMPSLEATAILIASLSSLRPQDAIGKAKSQSPLCGEDAAMKEAD